MALSAKCWPTFGKRGKEESDKAMINVARLVAVDSGLARLAHEPEHVGDISECGVDVCYRIVLDVLRNGLNIQAAAYEETKHAFRALLRTSLGRVLSWTARFLGQSFRLIGTTVRPACFPLGIHQFYGGLTRMLRRNALTTQIWIPPHGPTALGAFVIADYVVTAKEHTDGDEGWGSRGLTEESAIRSSWCPEERALRRALGDAYPPYSIGSALMKEYPHCL